MAQKVVKVKAHKRLDGTGKIENVDAHIRKIENKTATMLVPKINSIAANKDLSSAQKMGKIVDEMVGEYKGRDGSFKIMKSGATTMSMAGNYNGNDFYKINVNPKTALIAIENLVGK